MVISEADKRRYRMYTRKNKWGSWMYSLNDICKREGITRSTLMTSVAKFGPRQRKPGSGRRSLEKVLDNNSKVL